MLLLPTPRGASSMKFYMLAAGAADIHPRFGRTMQWARRLGMRCCTPLAASVKMLDGALLATVRAALTPTATPIPASSWSGGGVLPDFGPA